MSFDPKPWLQSLLKPLVEDAVKTAVDEALQQLGNELKADLAGLNATVINLPLRIVGDAEKDVNTLLREVVGTTNDIAGAVKGEVQPLFSAIPSLDSQSIANQLIGFIKSKLPFPFNQ